MNHCIHCGYEPGEDDQLIDEESCEDCHFQDLWEDERELENA